MVYRKTGNPPGRPRKVKPENLPVDDPNVVKIPGTTGEGAPMETPPEPTEVISGLRAQVWVGLGEGMTDADLGPEQPAKLKRAHEGFRRVQPNAGLHSPPRFGKRRNRENNRRPMLHPHIVTGTS